MQLFLALTRCLDLILEGIFLTQHALSNRIWIDEEDGDGQLAMTQDAFGTKHAYIKLTVH